MTMMCFCVSVSFSADGEIKHVFQIFINKKNVWYILYIFRICVLQLLISIGGVSKTWHVRGPATWKDILREKERDKKSEYYLSYCENHPDEQYIGENKENKQHWNIKKAMKANANANENYCSFGCVQMCRLRSRMRVAVWSFCIQIYNKH